MGDKYMFRDLGFRARDGRDASPKCHLRKTTADLRQMSGSQIQRRIRQKWTSTFSGTWALGQGRTGRISQMPSQENVRISNTKEDKEKVDKYIFRDLGFRPGTDG